MRITIALFFMLEAHDGWRTITLNMPLYKGVETVAIGLNADAEGLNTPQLASMKIIYSVVFFLFDIGTNG